MKTIVLKCKQNFYLIPLLFFIALLLTTCDKEPVKTYYKIKGFGYAFDTINKIPLAGAKVTVQTYVEGEGGLFGNYGPEIETYYTDFNGYYEINFMLKYGNLKTTWYYIEIFYRAKGYVYIYPFGIDVDDVRNAKKDIFFDAILTPY